MKTENENALVPVENNGKLDFVDTNDFEDTDEFEKFNNFFDFDATDADFFDFGKGGEYEGVDRVDSNVQSQDQKSDDSYQKTAREIVRISKDQLNKQYRSKTSIQNILLNFFVSLLFAQFLFIIVIVMLKGLNGNFELSNEIIIALITSVFVETLGVIAIMVRFAFDSKQEIEIISILHSYIKDFKIYKSSEHEIPKNNKDDNDDSWFI